MARAHLARPTDAPPAAHEPARPRARSSRSPAIPEPEASFLPPDDLPRHVAIIMDGNRRWARQRDLPELDGHAAGVEAIRNLLRHAVRRGVPVMTLYAFSRENWARSDDEVTGLFGLLEAAIRSETDELRAQGVRIRLLGRLDELPDATRASIGEALDATSGGERLQLNIAFNYAGRTELVDAFRRLAASGIPADEIDEGAISAALYTAGLPDPDLVIRTGGEQRLSNFLIWQSAYAEFYFVRRAVARLRPRRVRCRAARVRQPSTPLRALSGRTRGDASASHQCRGARARPAGRPRPRRRRSWPPPWRSSRPSPAIEVFRLLKRRRLRPLLGARHCARPRRRPRRGGPRGPRGQRAPARRRRDRAHRDRGVHQDRSDARGCRPGWRPSSGRCTSRCWRSSSVSGWTRRRSRAGAPLEPDRRRTRLDPAPRPRRLVVRHRRVPRRQELRPDAGSSPTSRRPRRSRASWAVSSRRRSSSR